MEQKKVPAIQYKTFTGAVKGWDDADLTIEHFISTELQDSRGDIMLADGMKLRGHPVVLFQHGLDAKYGSEPIAKVLDIRVGEYDGKKGLIAKTKYFDGSKLTPPDATGQRLYMKAKDGTMPNWSIGFNSIAEKPTKGGRIVTEWELHEYSQVAVGMNAEATTLSAQAPELKFIIKAEESEKPAAGGDMNDLSKKPDAAPAKLPASEKAIGSHKRAHKALHALHKELMRDLKAQGEREDFVDAGAAPCAKEALEDFTDCAAPHAEKYIKIVRNMGEADKFGDEEDDVCPDCGKDPCECVGETKGGEGSGRYPRGSGKNPRAEGGDEPHISNVSSVSGKDEVHNPTGAGKIVASSAPAAMRGAVNAAVEQSNIAHSLTDDLMGSDDAEAHAAAAEAHRSAAMEMREVSSSASDEKLSTNAELHAQNHDILSGFHADRAAEYGYDKAHHGKLEQKGYRASHNALRKCLTETIKEIRSCKGNKATVPAAEAERILAAHLDKALPHAVDFVKAWYSKYKADSALLEQETKPILKITLPDTAAPDPADDASKTVRISIQKPPAQVLTLKTPQPEPQRIFRLAVKAPNKPKIQVTPELVQELLKAAQAGMAASIRAEIRKAAGRVTP